MDVIRVGAEGGRGGTIWDEKGRGQIAGIFVSYGQKTVYSIQFLFYENGTLVMSEKHGVSNCHCQNSCGVVFDYPSEFLTYISGSFRGPGSYTFLNTLKFGTNKGSYGPFGTPSADAKDFNFQIRNHRIFGGFHGSENPAGIESIGTSSALWLPLIICLFVTSAIENCDLQILRCARESYHCNRDGEYIFFLAMNILNV
ncbi:hypothetical protein RND71_022714 [Anisodus tanguticus]|uniref:Jacalin-type lectin domain-containing protein n=1 Tax=Anisodus tanguticus TaxID=243964 RepID=A0AAE1RR79_9SOLA|nr:hypothetical protein RND71_022714 [Anisodus tanguticus]